MSPRSLSLTSESGVSWTVEATGDVPSEWAAIGAGVTPATVPGEVHIDLLAAGLIPDPFDADNESRLAWIGQMDWTYRTTFAWSAGDHTRHDLVAEGVDTVATFILNGHQVARTANQHRTYRFDVSALLREGLNELAVVFRSPVVEAQRRSAEIGDRPRAYDHPFNAIRKMASGYGWDWGPDLAGVGIWRPIRIESWSGVRLASVRPLATWDGTNGILDTHLELEWDTAAPTAGVQAAVEVAGQRCILDLTPGQIWGRSTSDSPTSRPGGRSATEVSRSIRWRSTCTPAVSRSAPGAAGSGSARSR